MEAPSAPPVRHNPAGTRFEIEVDGRMAIAEYVLDGGRMVFTHTWVPPKLRGRNLAAKLVRAGLDFARAQGHAVVPRCSYVARFIARHPEFGPLVAHETGGLAR